MLLTAFCLLSFGCRMDMQDQPKYKTFRAGDKKFFADGASVRQLVEGTVPRQTTGPYRDREDYFYTGKAGGAGAAAQNSGAITATVPPPSANAVGNASGGVPGAREAAATGGPDIFPFTIDEAALRRGRERFNIYCIVCHGATGEGDGMVVRRGYQKPPSYYDDRLQEGTTPAAHFFDVVTNGWGAMPSYAEQIPAEDRWKIIAYIRALQLSRRLKMNDLSPEERQKVLSGAQRPASVEHGGTELQSTQPGGQPSQVTGGRSH
ncbi:MAG: quinol:cytochrome C oxidoreductase [Acidobacteria bacterium]|nr:MAG: quinol:cytochrome C oxidoreductase [Acidobacteriota bacterium]